MLHHGLELLSAGLVPLRLRGARWLWAACLLLACSAPSQRGTHAQPLDAELESLEWTRLRASMDMRGERRARLGELAIEGLHWSPALTKSRLGDAIRTEGRMEYALHGLGAIQRVECEVGVEQGLTRARDAEARYETEAWLRCAFSSSRNLSLYFEPLDGGAWVVVTRSAAPGWRVRMARETSPWRAFVIEGDGRPLARLELDARPARIDVDASLDAATRATVLTLASAVSLAAGPLEWAVAPPA